jgi:hypothetical protein
MTTLERTQNVEMELQQLAEESEGLLLPERVVEFARDPETALHSRFTWDDSEAAAKWRLEEARRVIRMFVTVLEPVETPIKVYVSLESDRRGTGGYRRIEDVLTNGDMRRQLLDQARREFAIWKAKYQTLKELDPVFSAMETVA